MSPVIASSDRLLGAGSCRRVSHRRALMIVRAASSVVPATGPDSVQVPEAELELAEAEDGTDEDDSEIDDTV